MRYKTTDRHIHVLYMYLQINDVFCFLFCFFVSGRAEGNRLPYLPMYVAEPYGNVSRLLSLMQV